ncbi:hypothetical protein tooticki91_gp019 [Flavobacterium phage vB_FspS_tooticki9-1]|uniref:Uncharacterized protein n=17 Tax=Caudoviricetes TaxID=2731619 RepID=A0A6B9LGA8_9CAUD|nr:hypothetical protein HWC87_gp25 [Flavobacterium phage vB_FspS_filifjonk9-1]YP_009854673.1 hypothetical protein HWC88_gp21 [Flavobacterium phage vB_FspS_hattifnatt9-1]YP_009854882.1 hypothetical protein HWC91_gp27 [Flavobacterium phage vB_FspS_lillamy9-1]YP_009855022.1 hypothetical protein HWC93_gp21 [Flavobacterium phage vB_FspS_mumin9-1]YP_009855090.1 hypothetical protein HWC94_gp22 [Flavobacterium phage vB_FspS_mymlan6-1]YP_009855505.1 hypothetical protein HWD00_gp19 [Flavobacterium phage
MVSGLTFNLFANFSTNDFLSISCCSLCIIILFFTNIQTILIQITQQRYL